MGYCERDPYGGWEYIITREELKRAGLTHLIELDNNEEEE